MYLPTHFTHNDEALAQRLIHDHPFAVLVSVANAEPFMTHCPLVATHNEDGLTLHGHIARANPHHELWRADPESQVTAVFSGPQGYVSPNWYSAENVGKAVPTWNYAVVHARGTITVIDEEHAKDVTLKRLIARMEPAYAAQWRALPEDFKSRMLANIVAFEIRVSKLSCKLKLSQNRPAADKPLVIEKLEAQGEAEKRLAQWMREVNGL
jgi:transcriptional regulator